MPDRENLPRWMPGDDIAAWELNELAAATERAARVSVGQGIVSHSFVGTYESDRDEIFVKVLAQDGSANIYSFKEYSFQDGGTVLERDGGVSSDDGAGDDFAMPLIEVNSKTILPNTYVWARRSENGDYYVCDCKDTRLTVLQEGIVVGTRQKLNFNSGTYIAIAATDDAGNDRINLQPDPLHDLWVRVRKYVTFRCG